jgi:rod shape-determining protein MreD
MTLMLAAVGTTVAALFELTVVPYLRMGDAYPHLVFVLAVVVTIAVGFEGGLIWAFIGGLVLDVLAQRPIGSTAFALLLCVGGAAIFARAFSRLRPLIPIAAVFILSFVYSMSLLITIGALRTQVAVDDPIGVLAPGAIYDTVLAALVGPLAIALHDRRVAQERMDW